MAEFFAFILDFERTLSWYTIFCKEEPRKMPSETISRTFTVQEAAAKSGLSEHTLRYYERVGLLAPVSRDGSSRHRRYAENDLRVLDFLKRMRATGMSIRELQHYVTLYRTGDSTLPERLAMLEAHRQEVCGRIAELHSLLDVIDYKIASYQNYGAEGNWKTDECLTMTKGNETT